jgi:hypothetical protein
MTESFQEYYETFKELRDEVLGIIEDMSNDTGHKKTQLEHDARVKIDEVERYLRILDQEAKGGDAKDKRKMQSQMHVCRSDVEKLKSQLQKAILLGDAQKRRQIQSTDPKVQAAAYQERMDRTGVHLNEALETIGATESTAVNIEINLAQQREQLEQARENVDVAREDTQEAGYHLIRLASKTLSNIILLWFIILCLLAAIIYVLLYKFNAFGNRK